MNLYTGGALAAFAVTILFAFTFVQSGTQHSHQPDNQEIIQQGKVIYETRCATCHGRNLKGQAVWNRRRQKKYILGPAHDDTGHTWNHSHQQLFDMVKYGSVPTGDTDIKGRMPAFRWVLSDEEIWAVLSYIESQWPSDVRAKHDAIEGTGHD